MFVHVSTNEVINTQLILKAIYTPRDESLDGKSKLMLLVRVSEEIEEIEVTEWADRTFADLSNN